MDEYKYSDKFECLATQWFNIDLELSLQHDYLETWKSYKR